MHLNFLLREMTHLRYYIPIIEEGNKRGVKSRFLIVPSHKYNCPTLPDHRKLCGDLAESYGIEIYNGKLENLTGFFFVNENSGIEIANRISKLKKNKIIVLTYQTDFTACYPKYKDLADHILMPSKNIAKFYEIEDNKNLYLGIPKYDVSIDKDFVISKYALSPDKNKALVIWPKSRDLNKFPISIINSFHQLGWQVIVKARGKDPASESTKRNLKESGHKYFEDYWLPHTTQELLEASDLVINCGSTTIEECVMHQVPLINFDIKPEFRHGIKQKHRVTHSYLYDYDFCSNLRETNLHISPEELKEMIDDLFARDLKTAFKKCKKDWLYDHKNTCKNLLDVILS